MEAEKLIKDDSAGIREHYGLDAALIEVEVIVGEAEGKKTCKLYVGKETESSAVCARAEGGEGEGFVFELVKHVADDLKKEIAHGPTGKHEEKVNDDSRPDEKKRKRRKAKEGS